MDNLNARPQQRKLPDAPSPTGRPAAGHLSRAHTPSSGWVVWRGLTMRSSRCHFVARLNLGVMPSASPAIMKAHHELTKALIQKDRAVILRYVIHGLRAFD